MCSPLVFIENLCADPGTPLYSTRTNALQALFEPGEDTAVTCNRGFSLEGRKDLMCMPNGSWNYPLPLCEGKSKKHGEPAQIQATALKWNT